MSTAVKLSILSERTDIPQSYLIVLRREINSFNQKPVNLSEFPEVNEEIVKKLSEYNIKTSKDLYDLYMTELKSGIIAELTSFNNQKISELYLLCNLVRINGVGTVATRAVDLGVLDINTLFLHS